jgi:transposase
LNLTDQGELTQLRKEVEQLRMEREILKNSLLGARLPMQRNSLLLHSACVQTLAVSFLEVKSPSKNLADGKLRTQLWRHFM